MGALDRQVGGDHYQLRIQPVEYIIQNRLGFLEGQVIKYVSRHEKKGQAEDLKKAIHYLEMLLEYRYGEEQTQADRERIRRQLAESVKRRAAEQSAAAAEATRRGEIGEEKAKGCPKGCSCG